MEQGRKLDTSHTAALIIVFMFFIASCSAPAIRILKDPLTPEEHINLGLTYERDAEYAAALDHYGQASKRMPVAFLYMGNIYFMKGDYDQAETSYLTAINKAKHPQAYNNLAWLYYVKGERLNEAERLAGEAVKRSPDSEEFKDTLQKIRARLKPEN